MPLKWSAPKMKTVTVGPQCLPKSFHCCIKSRVPHTFHRFRLLIKSYISCIITHDCFGRFPVLLGRAFPWSTSRTHTRGQTGIGVLLLLFCCSPSSHACCDMHSIVFLLKFRVFSLKICIIRERFVRLKSACR